MSLKYPNFMTYSKGAKKSEAKEMFLAIQTYLECYLPWSYINPKMLFNFSKYVTKILFCFYTSFLLDSLLIPIIGSKFNPFSRPA